jgi:hypothetical protein
MPSRDDSGSSVTGPSADREEQQRMSRRSVLRGAAGAGAAGIAAVALTGVAAPAFAASSHAAHTAAGGDGAHEAAADTDDQIVVHVRDARSGEIDVFRGTSQTSLHDRELAARLVRASRS